MPKYDIERVRQAVQHLVDASYFSHHLKKLRNTLKRPRALPYRGELEVFNELLILGRQSEEAFENLLKLAEFKREHKPTYQRDYMAAKRQRDRKVIELEQKLTGKKLNLEQRIQVLRKQYSVWNKERDAMLRRVAHLSWADRNVELREFWSKKEQELDQLLHEANTYERPKKKRVVVVKPEKETALKGAMQKALDKRR